MRRVRRAIGALSAVALLGVTGACFDPFSYGTRAGGNSVPDSVTYEGDVYPILLSYCSVCHSSGASAGSSSFVLTDDAATDFDMVAGLVAAGDPTGSILLEKAAGRTNHGGSGTLAETSVEYQTLSAWVEQGAGQ